MSQLYRLSGIAASGGLYILHVDIRNEPDRARLEKVAVVVGVEGGPSDLGALLLPVPMSIMNNSFPMAGDLVELMTQDRFYEVRPDADRDAALDRLSSAFPCGLDCSWLPEDDAADVGLTFYRTHDEACPDSEEDHGPTEIEAAA